MQAALTVERRAEAEVSRVLIVEDEGIVALNLEQTLIRLGYQVVGLAQSGSEALRLIDSCRPDVVLMDINLGSGSDGIETAARITGEARPAVIYLTAYSERRTLARAAETRPYGYLLKPFSDRDVHATLQMALGRRRTDIALAESEERLRIALEAAQMGTWEYQIASRQMHGEPSTAAIVGTDAARFTQSLDQFLERVDPDDRAAVLQSMSESATSGLPLAVDFRSAAHHAAVRWVRLLAKRYDRPGLTSRLIGVAQDVTVSREAEMALRQASAVFESSSEAIFITDVHSTLIDVNASFTKVTGHALVAAVGRRLDGWLFRRAADREELDLDAELQRDGHWQGELVGVRADMTTFPIWLSMTRVPGENGTETRFVGIFSDIGALRRAELELIHQAHHDALTGLPNRRLAIERGEQAISRAKRKEWRTAVMVVDLDHLKHVNDALGHLAGDDFLLATANRLKNAVRLDDTVARLGGDEFIVILEDVASVEDVAEVARKLVDDLMQPLMINGSEARLGASIGISVFPEDGTDVTSLISAADLAMYRAKADGRHRYVFYEPALSERVLGRLAGERELRRALASQELLVFYQPQVRLSDMQMVGLEALVRWEHPTRGLIGATEIVPLAEGCNLIVDVGQYVLRTVCLQIRRWLDAGIDCPRVAINASVHQLRLSGFAEQVAAALLEAGITADRIELELTESTLQEEKVCKPVMNALAALGVTLAIDDFGTGYSSLASLRTLPLSRCKIDRSFVEEIDRRASDSVIAGAIIDLGHRLQLHIIAEGVETEAQLNVLRALGCDDVQGFLIAHPMSVDAITPLLEKGAPLFGDASEQPLPDLVQ